MTIYRVHVVLEIEGDPDIPDGDIDSWCLLASTDESEAVDAFAEASALCDGFVAEHPPEDY